MHFNRNGAPPPGPIPAGPANHSWAPLPQVPDHRHGAPCNERGLGQSRGIFLWLSMGKHRKFRALPCFEKLRFIAKETKEISRNEDKKPLCAISLRPGSSMKRADWVRMCPDT